MFTRKEYEIYSFETVPLDIDVFLMAQRFEKEYDEMMVAFFDGAEYRNIGQVSFVAARRINGDQIELSWFSNIFDRYHEIHIHLPRSAFIRCIGHYSSDEKPRLFVEDEWIDDLYTKNYSCFSLVDIANFKNALFGGLINGAKLLELRNRIDEIASSHPEYAFVSFADSLLIKSNWTVGYARSGLKNSYRPEGVLFVSSLIMDAYNETLAVPSYSIICQGENGFYDRELLHISPTRNHFCLNSLGIPFEQTQAIEKASREAIRAGQHEKCDMYLETTYFHSLNLKADNTLKRSREFPFKSTMLDIPGFYHPVDSKMLLSELEQ